MRLRKNTKIILCVVLVLYCLFIITTFTIKYNIEDNITTISGLNIKTLKNEVGTREYISHPEYIIHINYMEVGDRNIKNKYTNEIDSPCKIIPIFQSHEIPIGLSGKYYLNADNPYNISKSDIEDVLSNGFQKWVNISNDEYNILNTTSSWLFDGCINDKVTQKNQRSDIFFLNLNNPSILAITVLWRDAPGSNNFSESDIIFNANIGSGMISASPIQSNQFSLETIALHEIGHFLGVGHTPPTFTCSEAIMYPSLSVGVTKLDLTSVDKHGLINVYCPKIYESNVASLGYSINTIIILIAIAMKSY